MITINQMITHWQNMYGEANLLDSPTTILWGNLINKKVRNMIIEANESAYIQEESYVTTGSKTFTLPTDFESTRFFGCGLFYTKNDEIGEEIIFEVKDGGLLETDVTIPAGQTIKLLYMPRLTVLSDIDDEMIIPDEFMDVALYGFDFMYAQRDRDPVAINNASALFVESVNSMIDQIVDTPKLYSMPDPTNPF